GSLGGSSSWSAAPPRAAQAGLGSSGAHDVAARPAVPAQPMPGPEPLPGRGATGAGMAPPRRRVGPQQQPPVAPAPQPQVPAQPQPEPPAPARPRQAASVPAPRL